MLLLISVLVNGATSKPMLMKFAYPVQTGAHLEAFLFPLRNE